MVFGIEGRTHTEGVRRAVGPKMDEKQEDAGNNVMSTFIICNILEMQLEILC
jgi:hypothetical protein